VRARLAAGGRAVLHTGGAAALVVVLTWALCESRRNAVSSASTVAACADDNARAAPTPRKP
jgi:cytochrome c oxidase assembly protein subunit 15